MLKQLGQRSFVQQFEHNFGAGLLSQQLGKQFGKLGKQFGFKQFVLSDEGVRRRALLAPDFMCITEPTPAGICLILRVL